MQTKPFIANNVTTFSPIWLNFPGDFKRKTHATPRTLSKGSFPWYLGGQ